MTITVIRPSMADYRSPIVAEPGFIGAGQPIEIVEATAFKTVVREIKTD